MGKSHPPYTIQEVAKLMNLSPRTVTLIFEDEPGVLIFETPNVMRRRKSYRTIRIPRHVYERVKERHTRR